MYIRIVNISFAGREGWKKGEKSEYLRTSETAATCNSRRKSHRIYGPRGRTKQYSRVRDDEQLKTKTDVDFGPTVKRYRFVDERSPRVRYERWKPARFRESKKKHVDGTGRCFWRVYFFRTENGARRVARGSFFRLPVVCLSFFVFRRRQQSLLLFAQNNIRPKDLISFAEFRARAHIALRTRRESRSGPCTRIYRINKYIYIEIRGKYFRLRANLYAAKFEIQFRTRT